MADRTPNRVRTGRPMSGRVGHGAGHGMGHRRASRAEIDALGEIIAATIALAARARSEAAAALLERALATLHDRAGAVDGPEVNRSDVEARATAAFKRP